MGETLKPVMIPWLDPDDPDRRLRGGGVIQYPHEFYEELTKWIVQQEAEERRPRRRGRKPGTPRYTTAEAFLQDLHDPLTRLKGRRKVYISTLVRYSKVSRSTFYTTAARFNIDVKALIQKYTGDQT